MTGETDMEDDGVDVVVVVVTAPPYPACAEAPFAATAARATALGFILSMCCLVIKKYCRKLKVVVQRLMRSEVRPDGERRYSSGSFEDRASEDPPEAVIRERKLHD